MQRPTCYPQALASFVLASLQVLASLHAHVSAVFESCMHSHEPCASACVTLVCLDASLHSRVLHPEVLYTRNVHRTKLLVCVLLVKSSAHGKLINYF